RLRRCLESGRGAAPARPRHQGGPRARAAVFEGDRTMTRDHEHITVRSLCILACILSGIVVFWQPQARTQTMLTRGPYLQIATPASMIVRWRTGTATDSRVQYGTDAGNRGAHVDNTFSTSGHEVAVRSLSPATRAVNPAGSTAAIHSRG